MALYDAQPCGRRPVRWQVSELTNSGRLELGEAAYRYLVRVHRLKVGDRLTVFDPARHLEATATIAQIGQRGVACDVGDIVLAQRVANLGVTLVQGVAKLEKVEAVVRDVTALGVRRVVITQCQRSVARWEGAAGQAKLKRWRAVAGAAVRQCGRGDEPTVVGPLPFDETLQLFAGSDAQIWCCHPEGLTTPLGHALNRWNPQQELVILVGPEGGWSDEEVALMTAAGYLGVSLGPLVLRTELAATAAVATAVTYAHAQAEMPSSPPGPNDN